MFNLIEITVVIVIAFSIIKSLFLKQSSVVSEKLNDYFGSGDNKMSPFVAAISIFASLNGGFMVLGLVQVGYEGGLSGYILGLAYVIGIPLLIYILSRVKQSSFTNSVFGLDQLLLERYGIKTVTAYYLITGVVFIGVLGGQMLSIAQFLKKFDSAFMIVAVLSIGVFGTLFYTVRSGFKGVIKNDIIQSILEFSVSLIFPYYVFKFLLNSNKEFAFSPLAESVGGSYGISFPIFGALFLILTFSSRADLWQRINKVEKNKQKYALLLSAVLLTFFYFAMTSTGIAIKQNIGSLPIANGIKPSELVINLIQPLVTNPIILVFCIAGILIAVLSSLDSYLNLSSLAFTKFISSRKNPTFDNTITSDEDKYLLLTKARYTTIIVGLIGAVTAFFIPDIVQLMSASFSILGVLVPIVLVGVFSKRQQSDWVGALPLYVTLICLIVFIPVFKNIAFLPAFAVGFVTWIFMYILKKPDSSIKCDKAE